MPTPAYAEAIAYALGRLRSELGPEFAYHSLWHTEQDVLPAATRLGQLCGLPDPELRLLEVAAAFHDIGFIEGVSEHERRGADLAAQTLPGYGFTPEQIARVGGMIMATRLPQSPRSLAEQILADADLDVLGRPDFLERNQALRQELAALGQPSSDEEWRRAQLSFLQRHAYFTPAARALRGEGLRENLARFLAGG